MGQIYHRWMFLSANKPKLIMVKFESFSWRFALDRNLLQSSSAQTISVGFPECPSKRLCRLCWGYGQAKLWASRNPPERAPDRMRKDDLLQ